MGAVTSCVRPEQSEREKWYEEDSDVAPKVAPPPPKPKEAPKPAAPMAAASAGSAAAPAKPVEKPRDLPPSAAAAVAPVAAASGVEAVAGNGVGGELKPTSGEEGAMVDGAATPGAEGEVVVAEPKVPAAWEKHVGRALGMVSSLSKTLDRWCAELVAGLGLGGSLGMLASKGYFTGRKAKTVRAMAFNDLGFKLEGKESFDDLKKLLGEVPTWVNFKDFERVDWLNGVLKKVWPYYDAAICRSIRDSVEPILDQYRPPGITHLAFHTLTFGTNPFVLDGIRYHEPEKGKENDEVTLEIDFRWAGASKIILAIDVLGIRLVPQIRNLRLYGTFFIKFTPLCKAIPCFGAVVVSMSKEPTIQYKLDFGDISLMSVTTKPAIALTRIWVDKMIQDTLVGMLVWPNRLVVPILADEWLPKGHKSITELQLRVKAFAHVKLSKITDLPKMDTFGKTDAYATLQIRSSRLVKSKTVKSNLNPVFDEEFDLLVEEPREQFLKIQVYDHETWPKPDEFIARCRVPLAECPHGETKTFVLDLGDGDWSEEDLGDGKGKVHVEVSMTHFGKMRDAAKSRGTGALFVKLIKGVDLKKCDMISDSDPYVEFKIAAPKKLGKAHFQSSTVIDNNLNPEWNEAFEFINVEEGANLELTCWDKDPVGKDFMGSVSIPIADIKGATSEDEDTTTVKKTYKLGGEKVSTGEIELEMEWIPF